MRKYILYDFIESETRLSHAFPLMKSLIMNEARSEKAKPCFQNFCMKKEGKSYFPKTFWNYVDIWRKSGYANPQCPTFLPSKVQQPPDTHSFKISTRPRCGVGVCPAGKTYRIYHPKLNTLHTTDGLTDTKCNSTHLAVLQIRYVCNCICIVYWAYSHIPSIPCRQMI